MAGFEHGQARVGVRAGELLGVGGGDNVIVLAVEDQRRLAEETARQVSS